MQHLTDLEQHNHCDLLMQHFTNLEQHNHCDLLMQHFTNLEQHHHCGLLIPHFKYLKQHHYSDLLVQHFTDLEQHHNSDLLVQLQRDGSLGVDLHRLSPEAQLGLYGAPEAVGAALAVEGRHWRMVAHLFSDEPEPEVWSEETEGRQGDRFVHLFGLVS